jgi:hypothetical protein
MEVARTPKWYSVEKGKSGGWGGNGFDRRAVERRRILSGSAEWNVEEAAMGETLERKSLRRTFVHLKV